MLSEAIEVDAFKILCQMEFFDSKEIKALLHLAHLSIKLSDAQIMYCLILVLHLGEGNLDFKESLLLIIRHPLQVCLEVPLDVSFDLL